MRQSCSSHRTMKKWHFITFFFLPVREGWQNPLLPPNLIFLSVFKGTPPGHKDYLLKRRLWEVKSDPKHLNTACSYTDHEVPKAPCSLLKWGTSLSSLAQIPEALPLTGNRWVCREIPRRSPKERCNHGHHSSNQIRGKHSALKKPALCLVPG